MTALGIILLITPLALWVVWTETLFVVVLALGATSGVLCWVLAGYEDTIPKDQYEPQAPVSRQMLTDEFLAELTSFSPWIYHHHGLRNTAFQRKMDRLVRRMSNQKT